MTKRLFLCAILLLIFLLCACGKAEEAVTTEAPTSAPLTTAAPTTKAPEPETVISYDFRLEELPEIGRFRPNSVRYFYDAPMRYFQPSDDYGTLIPYSVGMQNLEIGRFGLMTADGRVVTRPIFSGVNTWTVDGETVFCAKRTVFNGRPETIPDWDTDQEGAKAAFRRAEEYYNNSESSVLISADGSRAVEAGGGYPYCFTDEVTGKTVIQCATYESDSYEESPGQMRSYRLYDSHLDLVADLSDYLSQYQTLRLLSVGDNSLILEGSVYEEHAFTLRHSDVLYFEDGQLNLTLDMGDEYVSDACGGLVNGDRRLYNRKGELVFTFGSDTRCLLAPEGGCYLYLPGDGKLLRLDDDGDEVGSVEAPRSGEDTYFSLCRYQGQPYAVISYSYLEEGKRGYAVYDARLRRVCLVDCSDAPESAMDAIYNDPRDVFLYVAQDGRTNIIGLDGKTVATLPFAYTNWYSLPDGYTLFTDENGHAEIFVREDRTVLPAGKGAAVSADDVSPTYCTGRLLVTYHYPGDWRDRYCDIRDLTAGTTPVDRAEDCTMLTVNGSDYLFYRKNDINYICDGELRPIASFYDDMLV